MSNTFFIFYAPWIVVALSVIAAFWISVKWNNDY